MIDVQRLRVLREVARHGSFSAAAAALRFTPSAVSQQIAALERTVGTTVVERSTRGVTLTEPGRLLVETAEAVLAELDRAREQIGRLAAGRTKLTIATFTSGGRHLLPAALTRFVTEWPGVEVDVVEREPEESVPMVRRGQADLALAYHFDGPLPTGPADRSALVWTPLLEDVMSVVLPPGHRLAGRDAVDLAELSGERWVLGCLKTEAFLRRHAARAGFELRVSGSTTDYFFAQALVAAGVGVSLVPRICLDPSALHVPVRPPRPTRYVGTVTAVRRRPQPHVDALVAALSPVSPV
ncbi:LysR family transcriptional regulator [Planomonospora corallina]|uniref:LysR family transcriptional regulator n=1 Tax=Planomonospora corallina TaxID=1806052 RepID=A0ABV8I5S7_9ACTN